MIEQSHYETLRDLHKMRQDNEDNPHTAAAFVDTPEAVKQRSPIAGILGEAAKIAQERFDQYGNTQTIIGDALAAFFPNGVVLRTAADHAEFYMFGQVVMKLSRFASSGLKHVDSAVDAMNYAAFCAAMVDEHAIEVKAP